jgi:hypothetical protein
MTIPRTLAAALAIAAIAVPATAQAQPADSHGSAAAQARVAQHKQDLRSPDTRDAAKGVTRSVLPVAPQWPVDPQPVTSAPAAQPSTKADDGVDWATIAIGIAGSLIAVGLLALVLNRRHTPRLGASV